MNFKVMVLPGDGIGLEVIRQARRVLEWVITERGLAADLQEFPYGAAAYPRYGAIISDEALADTYAADAILFGATGGPEYDDLPADARRKGGLLQMRKDLALFINLRPIVGYGELADASSLKPERVADVDVVLVRELNGGIYFGQPRGISVNQDGHRQGINTLVYAVPEIERIARAALDLARSRGGRMTSVDKSNVMETGVLWREVVSRVAVEEYGEVELKHILVDNCAMQLAANPGQFDVLLADNMFGDILSDIGGAISGSLGMLASASLSAPDADGGRRALYEPVHGSAPDIAGREIANPIAAILSVALMLRHSFERAGDGDLIEQAVRAALSQGARTPDIAANPAAALSTSGMGDAIMEQLKRLNS